MRSPSLHGRLLVAATIVLVAFLGLTGLALDRAYQNSIRISINDFLRGHLYSLLASADIDEAGDLIMPELLPEPRFGRPDSGLHAFVLDSRGIRVWSTRSALGFSPDFLPLLQPGERRFSGPEITDNDLFRLDLGVRWETDVGVDRNLTFSVAEHRDRFDRQVGAFRQSLWFWLTAAALVLLLVQGIILHWGLRPIRRAAEEVRRVEAGQLEALGEGYPRELRGLTGNVNTFIHNEKRHLERYRNTLGDLAHSLKTPLAVIRGLAEGNDAVQEQVDRMHLIVENQLRRAATSGRTTLLAPVGVESVVQKVTDSLAKVYSDRGIACSSNIEPGLQFFGEEGDLYEILGNLVDNAFKYGHRKVHVSAKSIGGHGERRPGIEIRVMDDGAGIPVAIRNRILERGERASADQPGQGLGLAVVCDVVESYDGSLEVQDSDIGGTQIVVRIEPA